MDAFALDGFAGLRHAGEPFGDQPADGGGCDIFLRVEFEQIAEARHVEAAGDDVAALPVFLRGGIGLVLVADFAQDDFDEVFHAGEAGGVAVLVDHDDHVGVVLLHLAHEVVDGLSLGHRADGAYQLADGAVGALVFIQLEHIAHMHEADDLIDGSFVDRDARILLVDDQLAQFFERSVRGDGHDIGAGRHDLAHHLIAELDHRLNELAILFFDEAFFGAGGDQRFDVFGLRGRLLGAVGVVGDLDERLEEGEHRHERFGEQAHGADEAREGGQPLRIGAAVEQLRQHVGHHNHGEPGSDGGFEYFRPGPGLTVGEDYEVENADQENGGVFDQCEGAGAVFGWEADLVFEGFLEEFDGGVVAGAQAEAFEIEQLDEGDQAQEEGEGGDEED